MQNKTLIKTCSLLIFILLSGISGRLHAQTFDEARKFAFGGERERARQICRQILSEGFNSDVALLLARTYAWDGKYDSTRIVLNEVLAKNPNSTEALDAFADVEYWSGNYEKAIEYCDLALKRDSTDEDFLFKKAKILHSSEQYEEAVATLEQLIRINDSNGEAMKKLQEFRFDVMKNRIRINYTIDQFDDAFNRDPWQIVALSYGRKTKLGSVIARVNMAKRFGNTGLQGEIDAYPKISENNYGYLNYGFSQSSVFPDHRLGVEWYHNFPKAYEGSIGMRTLFFSSSDVTIYTATFGKYISNYWISLRSFVTPGSDGTSVSGYLLARRYFSDPEKYFGLRLGYALSPAENQNLVDQNQNSRLNLKSMSVRLEFNHILNRVWIINPAVGWSSEELLSGSNPNYYTFDISITRLF